MYSRSTSQAVAGGSKFGPRTQIQETTTDCSQYSFNLCVLGCNELNAVSRFRDEVNTFKFKPHLFYIQLEKNI